jgi:hypothetical protein
MNTEAVVSVAKDFSRFPAGRYLSDGPYSGQAFRERYVEPQLRNGNSLTIDLDGVLGYGSSFLEEAFGGLVRCGFSVDQVLSHLKFLSRVDPSVEREIKSYITQGGAP